MILVKNMVLVLQKIKQVKIRVDLKEKESDQQNGIASLDGNRTLKVWVATRFRLIQVRKFRATLFVGSDSFGLNRKPWYPLHHEIVR